MSLNSTLASQIKQKQGKMQFPFDPTLTED
jgi:hypothetical protein